MLNQALTYKMHSMHSQNTALNGILNTEKTKVLVFSRGKIRKKPSITYGGSQIEIVYDFKYLGVTFNHNNNFVLAQKRLYDSASRAMFGLLKKCKNLTLPLEVKIELFDTLIAPILLYGSEVWFPKMNDLAMKLQLRYYKLILGLRKCTPTCMVLGEVGKLPLEIHAKLRMMTYWYKLVTCQNDNKLSSVTYKFFLKLKEAGGYESPFLKTVEKTLNDVGLPGVWIHQNNLNYSLECFKKMIKKRLEDIYIQNWYTEVNERESCYNYRMFKTDFGQESYLSKLPEHLAKTMLRFRVLNHNLPIHSLRFTATPRNERICTKCNEEIGDEFHYLFKCSFFNDTRKYSMKSYYYKFPNSLKFKQLLSSRNKALLLKLVHMMRVIMMSFK